ncbi:outer membrane porin, OprD family [Pseudomonas syringae]|nr:outer membrane porin, OprD family [Pseudomonas syringae]MCF5068984.1 outer membrane porin, OprD family [Pseudomonas syringae]
MYKQTMTAVLALAGLSSIGVHAADAAPQGFIEGSKASVSSRTMYFNNDNRVGGADQKETAEGLLFNYLSGYTQGTIGFGVDAQALVGIHLDGGKGHHPDSNTFFPSDSDGSAEKSWSRGGANVKAKLSKTELKIGSALQPSLPILVANDGRLLPQTFQGGMLSSKEFDGVTVNAGKITQAAGRASSNWAGLSIAGATQESNNFQYGGVDWKITKDLTVQAYHSQLEDFYKQTFLGLVHVYPISEGQTFKTDLRYFDSRSDGKNGQAGYAFNNNNGYAKNANEVDNKTWSAMFTYALGGHALTLGHQRVNDDGGFVYMSNGNITDSRGRNEGEGGSSFYLFTDSMINQFVRAGENTTFGQYTYDFTGLGVPGLKAGIAYLHGDNIKDIGNGGDHSEWERDMRIDYVVQTGPLKNFGATLRHGVYRGDDSGSVRDTDQTRLIFNYTYNFL